MKLKPVILSLFIVFFAFCAMGQSGCFDLFQQPLTPKASFPIGEFQGDLWVDASTFIFLDELRIEKRGDGDYIVIPAGMAPDGTYTMTFRDGSVLKVTIVNRWKEGDMAERITETDPTGAPLRGILKGSATWEMYTEDGEMLFLGQVRIPQRRYVYKDGQPIEMQDEVPIKFHGSGVGIYAGHVLQAEGTEHLEVRNGIPGIAGSGPGKIQ